MKSKVLTALLSLVIAFALWAYVVTVVSPESENTYYNVPVVLDGQSWLEERNLMIVSEQEFKVNLTLSGNRTDLNKLDSSNITLLADLSAITEPGTHILNYTVSYPGSVQGGTIHTVSQDPQQIELTVVQRSKKDIPVKVVYTGSLPDGYTAERQNITLDHTSVTVSGPKDVIDQITQAKVEIDLTGQTQTIVTTKPITLCGEDGNPIVDVSTVTVNVSNIRATVIIRMLKEIALELNVIPGGGITEQMAIILPDRTSITVSGSEAALKDLDKITLGSIDLGKLDLNTEELKFDIVLPEGVTNVTGVTTVTVKIQMPEMATRTYTVTRFEAVNLSAGMEASFLTEQLLVEIRGPAVLLDTLTAENIVAVVDFADAQVGTASYEATIRVEGVEGVGAAGSIDPVSAQVSAVQENAEG